jgi:uridine kinase
VGVAGGSGSGKTYFAEALCQALGKTSCEIVYQDNFYIDQSSKFDRDGGSVNFDHPDSLEFGLLAKHLQILKSGQSTQIPIYDFKTHTRKKETLRIEAKAIIIVDGILIFNAQDVRPLFDDLVFFDTPEELRFKRRLERDVKERGRSPEGVKAQFERQVKPMHDQFVDPSKIHAKTIIRDLGEFQNALDIYTTNLRKLCSEY